MVGWEGRVSDRLSSVLRSYSADTHTYMCRVLMRRTFSVHDADVQYRHTCANRLASASSSHIGNGAYLLTVKGLHGRCDC